jgi:deazaflavin-dependent oxidoreductase (nitroreductase family)
MSPRRLNPIERALAAFAASRPGSWWYLNVANPIDRRLLPLTGGRISLSLGQPVLCLEVAGAKSGNIRRTPLLFKEVDGELVTVASATGRPKHPAWYYNVRANPLVKVYAPGGRTGEYTARTASADERRGLWSEMVDLYPGFDVYEGRAAGIREIPIVVLSRA